MKKTFRLIAALLAFCVLSTAAPPVGLAVGETFTHLRLAQICLFIFETIP